MPLLDINPEARPSLGTHVIEVGFGHGRGKQFQWLPEPRVEVVWGWTKKCAWTVPAMIAKDRFSGLQ